MTHFEDDYENRSYSFSYPQRISKKINESKADKQDKNVKQETYSIRNSFSFSKLIIPKKKFQIEIITQVRT